MSRRRSPDPLKEQRAALRELRAEWKAWKRGTLWSSPGPDHIDLCLAPCADRCGRCEGCVATDYRAERMAEIEQRAAELGGEVRPQRKAKPEQLTFDVVEVAPNVYEDAGRWSR
jgi:hypothetical protein